MTRAKTQTLEKVASQLSNGRHKLRKVGEWSGFDQVDKPPTKDILNINYPAQNEEDSVTNQ